MNHLHYLQMLEHQKQAACILTISDSLVTKEATSSEERQTAINKMIEVALGSL